MDVIVRLLDRGNKTYLLKASKQWIGRTALTLSEDEGFAQMLRISQRMTTLSEMLIEYEDKQCQ